MIKLGDKILVRREGKNLGRKGFVTSVGTINFKIKLDEPVTDDILSWTSGEYYMSFWYDNTKNFYEYEIDIKSNRQHKINKILQYI